MSTRAAYTVSILMDEYMRARASILVASLDVRNYGHLARIILYYLTHEHVGPLDMLQVKRRLGPFSPHCVYVPGAEYEAAQVQLRKRGFRRGPLVAVRAFLDHLITHPFDGYEQRLRQVVWRPPFGEYGPRSAADRGGLGIELPTLTAPVVAKEVPVPVTVQVLAEVTAYAVANDITIKQAATYLLSSHPVLAAIRRDKAAADREPVMILDEAHPI